MQSIRKNVKDYKIECLDFIAFATEKEFFTIENGQLTQNYSSSFSKDGIEFAYKKYLNDPIDLSEGRVQIHKKWWYLLGGDTKTKIRVYEKWTNEMFDVNIRFIKKYKKYCFKIWNFWVPLVTIL